MSLVPFLNLKNRVRDKQIAMQNEVNPTYLKGNGKYYFRAYLVLFAVSFIGSNYQLINYVRGKGKKVGE